MNIQLKSIEDKDSFLIVTYEGKHSTAVTTFDFQMELVVYKFPGDNIKPVHLKKITGFEHTEADSIAEMFSEIARLAQHMVRTLERCTTSRVELPIRLEEEK